MQLVGRNTQQYFLFTKVFSIFSFYPCTNTQICLYLGRERERMRMRMRKRENENNKTISNLIDIMPMFVHSLWVLSFSQNVAIPYPTSGSQGPTAHGPMDHTRGTPVEAKGTGSYQALWRGQCRCCDCVYQVSLLGVACASSY